MIGILDIIILGLVAVGVVHGYRTGFFKQAGSILGILLGFALGINLMNAAGNYLVVVSGLDGALAPIVGFIAVFAGTYLLVQIISKVGESVLGAAKLGFVNRAMGGAIGGLKGALLVSIALIGLAYVQLPPESARQNSSMYVPVASVLPEAWRLISSNSAALDELSRRIEKAIPGEAPEASPAASPDTGSDTSSVEASAGEALSQ